MPTDSKAQAILGSALVGSLTLTFTDSFWYSAVETEVYGMAVLILAVMFLIYRTLQFFYGPDNLRSKNTTSYIKELFQNSLPEYF